MVINSIRDSAINGGIIIKTGLSEEIVSWLAFNGGDVEISTVFMIASPEKICNLELNG
ncbi:MAG: hypothetical protein ACJAVR_001192 [Paracoccaceae bacterium]